MAADHAEGKLTAAANSEESKFEQKNGDDITDNNNHVLGDGELPTIKIFSSEPQETLGSKGWLNVGKIPNNFDLSLSNAIGINNNEFVVSTSTGTKQYDDQYSGIWAYNVNKKHWKCVWEYDKNMIDEIILQPFMAYNPNTLELYIYSQKPDIFFSINILNGKHIVYNKNKFDMDYSMESMIYCNDHIHLISSNKHIIWDCNNQKESKILTNFINGSDRESFSVIYLKKQNCIWLVGGIGSLRFFDDIHQFDLNKFEWNKLTNIKLPKQLASFSCVMSTDDRYLVIMNGDDKYGQQNKKIYFLDFNNIDKKWKKSKMKIAINDYHIKAILFDQPLSLKKMNVCLNGLLKRLSIVIFLPNDIVLLIKKMYSNEMIHLIHNAHMSKAQYTISFEKILK